MSHGPWTSLNIKYLTLNPCQGEGNLRIESRSDQSSNPFARHRNKRLRI
jgi:hypothetical protein